MFIFSQYLQTWEAHSGLSQKLDINKKSTIFNHEQLCFGRGKGGKGLGKGMGHARHPTHGVDDVTTKVANGFPPKNQLA